MRLHTLHLNAVGPFADEQIVDFDRLSAGGLFLFDGPTGVGKSTILDALTFALYGGLASESGDPARMRSDFADPGARPEVTLEFSVRGGRHRITRSPEYTRPKKRGQGVTREKSSVHLQRLVEGAWESRSHAKDEVGVIIGELLGLSRDQFRQVVLLPQGEFATFLRADDDQRREVLGRLFGTQFFRRITEGLQARAQDASRALQAADSELQSRVAAATEAAGLGPDDNAELSGPALSDRLDGLRVLDAHLQRRSNAARQVAEVVDAWRADARAESEAAKSVVERLERRAAVELVLAEARSQRPEHEQRKMALARARQALPVRPLLDMADRASEAVDELREAVVDTSPPEGPSADHLSGVGWQELAIAATRARTTVGELAHLVVVEDQLAADRAAVADQTSAVAQLQERSASAQRRASCVPEELAAARTALATAQKQAGATAAAEALLEAIAPQAQAAASLAALREQVEKCRDARRAAKRAFEEARDHHVLLVDQQLADARGQLAARLVSGDPCLVCGSQEHPAPARSVVSELSSDQVRESAARRDDARLILDDAEAALVRAQADLDHGTEVAGGRSTVEWEQRIDGLREELAVGQAAQESLPGHEARVLELATEERELGAHLIVISEELAGAQAQLAHRVTELADREAQVGAARGEFGSVRERAAALVASAAASEEQAAAVSDLARGIQDLSKARDRAVAEAHEAGFVDLADVRAALLAPAELEQLDSEVARWEAAVSSAHDQLATAELRGVADIDPAAAAADARTADHELERAEAQAELAHAEETVATRQRERYSQRLLEVTQCAAEREGLAHSHAELVALDQYARGMAGSPRMSLVTFVLRYWFEQVVLAANVRLESMSAGKYELLRVDEGARRDARVGLGLSVLDRHTGRERSPGTLSGGESFYTSLALALGLADVVVAQAGGAQLDTLFIDEGFGSLDPDTLDDVMGVIDDLRGNGRVIGIVSHVPELKDRIAERLSVRRVRPDGPSMVEVRA